MAGISLSFRPGIIGATITFTRTPASASRVIAFNREAGGLVRGSIVWAKAASSVVTLSDTWTTSCDAISRSTSKSRVTNAFFVIIPTG